ncbi:MAG: MFS transporter [Eubacteriaceae bacterium]|nr:MFS transporter [Eubacteriaceae bacterium]
MEEKKAQQMTNLATWMFFLNYFTQFFGSAVAGSFMNLFMTNYMLLTPMVVAGVLTVGRAVDTGLSLIAGSVVQKMNFKTGPYRTWLLIHAPLLIIGNFMMFLNPDLPGNGKLWFFIAGYIIRTLPVNFVFAAQNTLVTVVAGADSNNRITLNARNSQGMNAATIITSAVTITFINYFNSRFADGRGYLIVSMIYLTLQFVGQVVVYIYLAPYDKYDPDLKRVQGSSKNVGMGLVYADTFKNPYIWLLIFIALFFNLSYFTIVPNAVYVFTYAMGNMNLMALNNTITSIVGLGIAFIAPPIAKKLGKRNSVLIGNLSGAIFNTCLALFGGTRFPLFLAISICMRLFAGPGGVVGLNLWMDAAEYQMYKTGRDSRPFILSLNSICMRVAQLIASFSTAWVLIFCEYVSYGPGDVRLNPQKLVWGIYGIAAVCSLCQFIGYVLFRITDEQSAEYAEHNRKMLAERAAEQAKEGEPA